MKTSQMGPVVFALLILSVFMTPVVDDVIADDETTSNGNTAEQPSLTDAEFRKLHAALQPKADELWRTIPWNISLLDAQRVAAESKKPLFIWAMDGHPLGCT